MIMSLQEVGQAAVKGRLKCVVVSAGAFFTESGLLVKYLKEMLAGPESSHTQLLPNNQPVSVCDFICAGLCILVYYARVYLHLQSYCGTHHLCVSLCVCWGLFV